MTNDCKEIRLGVEEDEKDMTAYTMRALEIHNDLMWHEAEIRRALDLIERYEMTALVLHEPDLFNKITFPRAYFQPWSRWGSAPPRRGENLIYNAIAYMQSVMEQCSARGVELWFNVKELAFTDEFVERNPDMVVDGKVCPTHPAWDEFLDARYRDVVEDFPDIAGVVVSVGSPEGRATLAARRCSCQRCADTTAPAWYTRITSALYGPLAEANKRLVVREFSYKPRDQDAVVEGLAAMPSEVEFCVKPYARDYYPTYPDNPAIVALPERVKWLEYDVNGQYYGWGVFPCPVTHDLSRRLKRGVEVGATGVIYRTDWERVNDLTALHNFSQVNLAAGAYLAKMPDADPKEVLAWALDETGIVDPAVKPEVRRQIASTLLRLWPLVEKTLYIQGFVYNTSSRIPDGVDHAWWVFAQNHNLADWDPDAAARIDVADPATTAAMLEEKERGRAELGEVLAELRHWVSLGALHIPDPCRLGDVVSFMADYIEAFVATGKVVILVRAARERSNRLTPDEMEALRAETDILRALVERIETNRKMGAHTHHVRLLLNSDRIRRMITDAESVLEGVKAS